MERERHSETETETKKRDADIATGPVFGDKHGNINYHTHTPALTDSGMRPK